MYVLYAAFIYGCFSLIEGIAKNYNKIYDGAWLSGLPYATIHKVA